VPAKVGDAPKIKMLEERNVRKGFFEAQQFHDLRAKLPKHLHGPITIAYFYGLRRAEIVGLTWENIDLDAGIIRLESEDTKNEEPRTIYYNDECRAIIQAQWDARKDRKVISPLVFLNGSGKGIITDFRKSWGTACEAIGLKGRLFHDLRRTAVRNMIRAHIPQVVAMAISGHRTTSIFNRYNIVDDEDLINASASITAHHEAQPVSRQEDRVIKGDFSKGRKAVKKTA
jgi:integrase